MSCHPYVHSMSCRFYELPLLWVAAPPFIYLSFLLVCPYVCPSICLSVRLSIYLSVRPFVCANILGQLVNFFISPFQTVSSNGEVGVVVDDDVAGFDGDAFPSGSVTENWSDQLTMKVKVSDFEKKNSFGSASSHSGKGHVLLNKQRRRTTLILSLSLCSHQPQP